MNILLVSCVFPPEPVVSSMMSFDLAISLSYKGNVLVVAPFPSRPHGYNYGSLSKEIEIHSFRKFRIKSFTYSKSGFLGRALESFSFGFATLKFVIKNKKNIDVIYANTWPIFAQAFAVLVARKLRIPIILQIQDIYPESVINRLFFGSKIIRSLLIWFDSKVLESATRIVTVTQGMVQYLVEVRKMNNSKIDLVYTWQDENRFTQVVCQDQTSDSKLLAFIFLGNISYAAAPETILMGFHLASLHSAKLVFAGSGSELSKLKEIKWEKRIENVHFIKAPFEEVGTIQASGDILILGLRKNAGKYALPSKLAAYMFSGKPVIACVDNYCDTAKIIRLSGCGWVVEPENPEELSILIRQIVSLDKSVLYAMGEKGKKFALENFTRERNLKKLESIILGCFNNEH